MRGLHSRHSLLRLSSTALHSRPVPHSPDAQKTARHSRRPSLRSNSPNHLPVRRSVRPKKAQRSRRPVLARWPHGGVRLVAARTQWHRSQRNPARNTRFEDAWCGKALLPRDPRQDRTSTRR